MPFRSAFLGCGPRAAGHAAAYQHITRGEKVACCDLDEERLKAFGDAWEIDRRYTDLAEMLGKEQPDMVHVVTPPTLRVGLMRQLTEAGVPAVIVEKPICIGADDYKQLRELEASASTKFTVNHQLRYHPMVLDFLQATADGKIGEVKFLDASAILPMAGQGVHILDLTFAFNGYARPQTVFGASSGYDDINGTHPSPRTAAWMITFENGARAVLQAGEGAPQFEPGPSWAHKRIAVYGTHGFLHWRVNGWDRSLPDGTVEHGEKQYAAEDVIGQANLTNAVFDWLADDGKPTATNLATSLDEWIVILAGYLSTVEARPVDLPLDPPDDLLDRFKASVGAG
ncbi:MAG: Gfo/Idh/MocA family protein [Armatimonadota bacterium]